MSVTLMALVLLTATPRWVDMGNNSGAGFSFLNAAAGGTITAWINTTRVSGLDQSIAGVAIGPAGGTSNSSRLRLGIAGGAPFLIGRNLDGVSPTTVTAGSAVTANTWTHVAGTYDCVPRLATLYINGVSVGSGIFTNSTAANFSATNTKNGAFGSGVLGTDTWFDGQIADVRLYQAVLTADELRTMWAMRAHDGIRRTAGVLQLRYRFDEAAAGIVATTANLHDSSGALILPSPFAVTGAPVFAAGVLAPRRIAA
jgi:hypothetical protein